MQASLINNTFKIVVQKLLGTLITFCWCCVHLLKTLWVQAVLKKSWSIAILCNLRFIQGYSHTSDFSYDFATSWCNLNSYITSTLYIQHCCCKVSEYFRNPSFCFSKGEGTSNNIINGKSIKERIAVFYYNPQHWHCFL